MMTGEIAKLVERRNESDIAAMERRAEEIIATIIDTQNNIKNLNTEIEVLRKELKSLSHEDTTLEKVLGKE